VLGGGVGGVGPWSIQLSVFRLISANVESVPRDILRPMIITHRAGGGVTTFQFYQRYLAITCYCLGVSLHIALWWP
jgi:uncharacterized protein YqfA (UPF0365 family)